LLDHVEAQGGVASPSLPTSQVSSHAPNPKFDLGIQCLTSLDLGLRFELHSVVCLLMWFGLKLSLSCLTGGFVMFPPTSGIFSLTSQITTPIIYVVLY
jgi:hypothetical protein